LPERFGDLDKGGKRIPAETPEYHNHNLSSEDDIGCDKIAKKAEESVKRTSKAELTVGKSTKCSDRAFDRNLRSSSVIC
jgi:hypothetical protein